MTSIVHPVVALVVLVAAQEPVPPPAGPSPPDAAPAPANEADGATLYAEGVRLFTAGDFAGAARKFKALHLESGDPNALYNLGRTAEALGDLPAAIAYFKQFIVAPGVGLENRDQAMRRIDVLMRVVTQSQPPPPAQEVIAEPQPDPPQPVAVPTVRRGPRALLGVGVPLALGAAGTASVAIAFTVRAADAHRTYLDAPPSYAERESLRAVGVHDSQVAIGLWIGAGVLTVTSAALLVIRGRMLRRDPVRAAWLGTAVQLRF